MLDKLSLNAKFLILSISMAMITVLVCGYSYYGLTSINTAQHQVTDVAVPNTLLINSMALHYRNIRIHLRTLGLAGLDKNAKDEAAKLTIKDIEMYEKDNTQYKNTPFIEGEEALYKDLEENWLAFKKVGEKALALNQSGKDEDKEALMQIFLKDCPILSDNYNASLTKLQEFHERNFKAFTFKSNALTDSIIRNIIMISVIGILLGVVITTLFAMNASKLSKKINEIAYSLRESSDRVSTVAGEISNSSEGLSQATTEQAASLQETSSSIEEINSMISANTQSAVISAKESQQSLMNAEKGKRVVEDMIEAVNKINQSNNQIMEQINTSNNEIGDIVKLIGEIGNKTKVINDIVFQTKLLSFNASVEAARAGENGKGFAVVAEEVGNLAAMSGAAAVEISSLLDRSIQQVETIVRNSKDKVGKLVAEGKASVDTGARVANECGVVLDEIVKSAANVSSSLSEISTASQEQAQGVQEVTKAVAQLDQVTQENSNTAAESAKAAGVLTEQSSMLSELVEDLVSAIEGNKRAEVKAVKSIVKEVRPQPVAKVEKKVTQLFPHANDSRFSDV